MNISRPAANQSKSVELSEASQGDVSGSTERIRKSDLSPIRARFIETDASAQECVSTPDHLLYDDGPEQNQEVALALKENLQTLSNQPPNCEIPNAAKLNPICQANVQCPDPGGAH